MNRLPPTPPVLRGAHGNAWLLDMNAIVKNPNDPRKAVTLPTYVAHAAYAHPMWHSYLVMCVNLRDLPGVQKAKINLAGATHEIMVFALDPEQELSTTKMPLLLTPVNFVAQFIEPDDAAAEARIKQTVQDVIDGKLNPDTDYGQHWIHRFGASNVKGDPKALGETRITMDPGDGSAPVEVVIPPQPGPQDLH